MKVRPALPLSRITDYRPSPARRDLPSRPSHRSGTAVLVVLMIVAILMIYVAGNVRTLNNLGHEIKLIEQKQTRRLEKLQAPASNIQKSSQPQSHHSVGESGLPARGNSAAPRGNGQ